VRGRTLRTPTWHRASTVTRWRRCQKALQPGVPATHEMWLEGDCKGKSSEDSNVAQVDCSEMWLEGDCKGKSSEDYNVAQVECSGWVAELCSFGLCSSGCQARLRKLQMGTHLPPPP